jgi:S1-C subfamily serine protease
VQLSDGQVEGTGFVVQSDGSGTYVMTNRHVVDGASAGSIRVIGPDGHTSYRVQAVAVNTAKVGTAGDLAVLKVPPTSLQPLAFGKSDALQTGQTVASIGYGLAFQLAGPPSVTEGIISALRRDLGDGFGPVWIQHQSTINHGNSGGPLLDLKGDVVGVNTLSIDQLPGANGNEPVQGIFFAIPSSIAQGVARTLIQQLRGGSFSELKATAARAVQVKTTLFTVTAPRGWIAGKIGKDRPLLISRDGLVQVQFQTVTVGQAPSQTRLRGMIMQLAKAVGKMKSLTYRAVRAGTLHGVIGTARYSNRTYRLTAAALPDKKGRHVFIVAVIQLPGATSADGAQAMAVVTSLRATGR